MKDVRRKRVIVRWTEIRIYDVPEEAPTDNFDGFSTALGNDLIPFLIQRHIHAPEIVEAYRVPKRRCPSYLWSAPSIN